MKIWLSSVTVKLTEDEKYLSVWPHYEGVDRPETAGWVVHERNVGRLCRALLDGVAETLLSNEIPLIDIHGQTYAHTKSNIYAKRMGADLTRLGY